MNVKNNNEIKDIIKVIKSSENRGILLRETIEKVGSKKKRGLLGLLIRVGLPLIKNTLTPLTINVFFAITCSSSNVGKDTVIKKKILGLGTKLIISDDIKKIVPSLGKYGLLIKGVSETITNKAKEQIDGFLGMLLRTLGAIIMVIIL